MFTYVRGYFILAVPCNIVFVHFKSAPPRNTLFSGGKACVDTTVPGNLLFDISVYSLHQFINWDFVANACNSGRIAELKIYLDKTKPSGLFVCFTFKSFITPFQMKFCESFTYIYISTHSKPVVVKKKISVILNICLNDFRETVTARVIRCLLRNSIHQPKCILRVFVRLGHVN